MCFKGFEEWGEKCWVPSLPSFPQHSCHGSVVLVWGDCLWMHNHIMNVNVWIMMKFYIRGAKAFLGQA